MVLLLEYINHQDPSTMLTKLFSAVALLVALCLGPVAAKAHEVNPVVIDITLADDRATLDIEFNAEIFLAGINASQVTDTNASANADDYDRLRSLDAEQLEGMLKDDAARLLEMITLSSDQSQVALTLEQVATATNTNLEVPRLTAIQLSAVLPPADGAGGSSVVLRLAPEMGAYIIRQQSSLLSEDELYADYIAAGLETLPIPRDTMLDRSWHEIMVQYVISGIAHIIPKGLDHIIFIMGLFFFSPKIRPLVMQVTVFTLAHSFTLVLATLGWVSVPASVVEPLIAASIVWIGVENILKPKIGIGRLGVIFTFGLLHGLGFAFVLGEVGLAGSAFAISLIAFNIGVEIGQLLVLAPLLVVGVLFSHRKGYRQRLEIPASAAIAAVGLYWFLERVFGG